MFSDMICSLRGTRQGLQLIELINQQLEQVGLQVVATARN
jgi:hypothetical protein